MELYPFRYRDPLTGKWVKARYVAERHEIAARYQEWEITGAAEIRASRYQRATSAHIPGGEFAAERSAGPVAR